LLHKRQVEFINSIDKLIDANTVKVMSWLESTGVLSGGDLVGVGLVVGAGLLVGTGTIRPVH